MSLDDKKLLDLVEESINGYVYDIAKIVHYIYKERYVCGKLKNKLWFHFDNHKWRQTELGPYKEISTNILDLFVKYKEINSDESLNEKIDNLILKLKNVTFKENICRECLYLFYDSEFINILDRKIHLICFKNGVWDLREKTFRNGKKEDFISISIDVEYNNNLDDLQENINKFIEYRKKILIKRSPNHVFKIN